MDPKSVSQIPRYLNFDSRVRHGLMRRIRGVSSRPGIFHSDNILYSGSHFERFYDLLTLCYYSDAWGGAIELNVLAKHFDIEICSIDVQVCHIIFSTYEHHSSISVQWEELDSLVSSELSHKLNFNFPPNTSQLFTQSHDQTNTHSPSESTATTAKHPAKPDASSSTAASTTTP